MANWVPVTYAVTGKKEELLDFVQKVHEAEQIALKRDHDDNWRTANTADLAPLLGSTLKCADLRGYWHCADEECDSVEWKTTADGEEYVEWEITNKSWEEPKTREMIEAAYTSVKIYYQAPAKDTNDTDERYFHLGPKPVNIDGLNYYLNKEKHEASLNFDTMWDKEEVLFIPEKVTCNGEEYVVTAVFDNEVDYQFGGNSTPPVRVNEVFFPQTVREICDLCGNESIHTIHLPDGCKLVNAFSCFSKLEKVELGKDMLLENSMCQCFEGTPYKESFKNVFVCDDVFVNYDETAKQLDKCDDNPFCDYDSEVTYAERMAVAQPDEGAVEGLRHLSLFANVVLFAEYSNNIYFNHTDQHNVLHDWIDEHIVGDTFIDFPLVIGPWSPRNRTPLYYCAYFVWRHYHGMKVTCLATDEESDLLPDWPSVVTYLEERLKG
ncbi:MAG: hypothetical protein Q4B58_06985 [Bacteroidales bacterium]|nr:hypothetical protein [Bacteroidales bacterium]